MSEEEKAVCSEAAEEKKTAEGAESVTENTDAAKGEGGPQEEAAGSEKQPEEDGRAEEKDPKQEAQQAESEKYARLYAEFQNYKRRTEKEKSDLYAYAGEKFAKDLLEVIDNFERAMEAAPEDDKFAQGFGMILTQIKGVMEKNHVEEIKALGEPFDPNFHNAVMTEAAEDTESGIVTKVFQKGYLLNGKVIRPSMVAVSQ